jgi:hypothetical protein
MGNNYSGVSQKVSSMSRINRDEICEYLGNIKQIYDIIS